jgi:hypothetical protein
VGEPASLVCYTAMLNTLIHQRKATKCAVDNVGVVGDFGFNFIRPQPGGLCSGASKTFVA